MKLTFLGAAHEVTGSRYLLEACGKRILVDYGMEQGVNLYENAALPYPAETIDFVLLTHAHIDHSGWLPLLTRQGFHGKIYSTAATADLCAISIDDISLAPCYDAASLLVYSAGREHVTDVWVNGTMRVADGELLQANEIELIKLAALWQNQICPRDV